MSVILIPELLLRSSAAQPEKLAVAVEGARIVAIDIAENLQQQFPTFDIQALGGCLLMPGMVNAHQHGRGLSQVQLGYLDDFLEPWVASRRARGILDAYAITRLAALRMAANGVTTAIHANYTYGSGDYETEVCDQIRAYREVGIRVAMCVGAMDRGTVAYPPHEACFCAGLPKDVRDWVIGQGANAYAGDGASTIKLMETLIARFGQDPGVRLFYGPAGPQWVSDGLWRELCDDAKRKGLGIHFHGMESSAQRLATQQLYPGGTYAHLEKLGALTPATVIAHAVQVTEEDVDVIARCGATVVRNPACNLRVRSGIAPLPSYLHKGVPVAVGTDNIAFRDDEDLLGELRLADLLARSPEWTGLPTPTTAQLLQMLTKNGAVAAGFGSETGAIEPGMSADLVAVSLDRTRMPYLDPDMCLLTAFLTRATGSDVRMTMVHGKMIYANGAFPHLNEDEIERAAVKAAIATRRPNDIENVERAHLVIRGLKEHYGSLARQSLNSGGVSVSSTKAPTI